MKSKLTISRKLLILWVITTIATLISVAFVFQFLLLRYDETLAREQLSTSYNNLVQQLDARMNEMKSHADTLAKREDISSGVNLVSKYQNKNNYDAIAFDPEKKKLGVQLSEVTVDYSKLIIYDKDLDIIAISDHHANGDAYVAITSYQDGKPAFLSSLLLDSNYQESEVPLDLPVMNEIPDNVVIKLVETAGSFSVLAIAPIIREYVNGSYDVVGMISISDDLTSYVDINVSSLIGLPIQLYSKAQLSNVIEDDQYVFEDKGGEIVALLTGASNVWAESDSHYLSVHPLSLPEGPMAYLGLKLDKLELSAQLNTLRDSVIWVTLGMLVILLSLGRWFITRIITQPIQALLDGIKRVSGGKYGALSLVNTQDELGSLARSFEDMASEVRIREQKLTDILRLAPEGIITVNSDFKITLFSDGARRIFQYNEKDILGKSINTLLPDRIREKHVGYMAEFDGSKEDRLIMGRRGEVLGLRNGGEEFPAAASISKLHIGNEKMFTVIIQDITERKNTEAELLSAKINAEAANETKSQFLASMSHDLRTPLNAIIGMSDMMKVEVFGELNAKYREYAEDIVLSGQHLLSLVDELLDISTIEAGKRYLTKEPLSAQAVIGDCFKMLTVRAKQDGVNLSQDIPEDLSDFMADKQAVQKILLNLLSNAIKFSPIKGDVCISAHESQTHVVMTIKDNGMGIPQDKIADLMQPFTRYEKDAHKPVEGWGLGLAISKSLVDLHNGSIWIDSALGEGTEVHVSFPKE